jgi:hypothetical protein
MVTRTNNEISTWTKGVDDNREIEMAAGDSANNLYLSA